MSEHVEPAGPPTVVEDKAVAYLREKVKPLLIQGEEVLAIAEQHPRYRWWILPPDGAVVTSHRIFLLRCNVFSFSFVDMHWEHVEDVHLDVGLLGATIAVTGSVRKTGMATRSTAGKTKRQTLNNLVKTSAQDVYRIGQELENKWRGIVRDRAMEETRAAHGHYVVQTSSPGPEQGKGGPAARLKELKAMLDSDLISQDEYAAKKTQIVDQL